MELMKINTIMTHEQDQKNIVNINFPKFSNGLIDKHIKIDILNIFK